MVNKYVEEMTTIVIYDRIFDESSKNLLSEPTQQGEIFDSMQEIEAYYEDSLGD